MESLDGAIKKKTLSQTLKARTSNKQAVTRDTFDISRDKGRQLREGQADVCVAASFEGSPMGKFLQSPEKLSENHNSYNCL